MNTSLLNITKTVQSSQLVGTPKFESKTRGNKMSGTVQRESYFKFGFMVLRFRCSHYSGAWNRPGRRIKRGRFL